MPEIAPIEILMLAGMLVLGVVLGWIFRGGRCAKEKIAVNAGWQEQLEAQRSEHDRLGEQNRSLMQQISQYQASIKNSNLRAKELSASLRETFERRDELQRQLGEFRDSLNVVTAQRDKLRAAVENRDEASTTANRERDNKIFMLSRELTAWQSRVPPLVTRFRERDLEAQQLEVELQQARERITALESVIGPDQTRIEPVDPNALADGLNASNDPLDDPAGQFENDLVDQDDSYNEVFAAADETPPDAAAAAESDAESGTSSAIFDALGQPDTDPHADAQTPELEASVNDSELAENDADDLKLIKGVGPALEKTLNDLGIYRFNQLAEMSEYDIDRVAQHLKGFRSRIYREDWLGQARSLQYQKNNYLV